MTDLIVLPSPCLVVLIGPAGSGKSTWAAAHFAAGQVISSDALRAMAGDGEHDMSASKDAFSLVEQIVRLRLGRRLTAVVDSLHLEADQRERWRAIATEHQIPCVAIVMATPVPEIRTRNKARPRRVPDGVHTAQLRKWPDVVAAVRGEPFGAVHEVLSPRADDGGTTADGASPPHLPQSLSTGGKQPGGPAGRVVLSPSSLVTTNEHTKATESSACAPRPDAASLRFGLQVPRYTWTGGPAEIAPRLRDIALAAEAAGFDQLWVMDHFRQIPMMGRAWDDMLESYTTLGYLAGVTSTIRLGTMVTGVTYRNIAHLAKIVATLDVVSNGRAMCGLGTAWFKQEHEAYGWPFPTVKERYDILRDALDLLPMMWGPGMPRFDGRTITVPETMCYPRPLQAKIPILVGGSGEKTTLRIVAKYADACNLFGEADAVRRKIEVLHRHCADFGRDPADIEVTQLSTVMVGDSHEAVARWVESNKPRQMSAERFARSINAGTVEQHVGRVQALADIGVNRVIVSLADLDDSQAIERFTPVITAVQLPENR